MSKVEKIPFELRLHKPNELTLKVLEESEKSLNFNGSYETVSELMEALNAED